MIVYHLELQHLAVCQQPMLYEAVSDGYVPIKNSRKIEAYLESMGIGITQLDCQVIEEDGEYSLEIQYPEPDEDEDNFTDHLIEEFVHPQSVKGLHEKEIFNVVDFINTDDATLLEISQITEKTLPKLKEKAKELVKPIELNKDEEEKEKDED